MNWLHPVEDPRTRNWRAWVLDGAVMLVVATVALPYLVRHAPDPKWFAATGTALMVLPLLVRRIWPVPVYGFVVVVAIGFGTWDLRLSGNLALPVALFTVAAYGTRRQAYVGAAVLEALALAAAIWLSSGDTLAVAVLLTGMVAAALGLGLYQATRRAYVRELLDRAEQLERERDQTNELAAAAERARIAREMHDIVAHHLTVMVALSDGATRLSATDPAAAGEAMRAVSTTGRDALRDTRRLLGVLGDDDDPTGSATGRSDHDRRPLPGLSDLEGLIEQVRAAGLPVDLRVAGSPVPLASVAQLAIYRLVQESLTNTLKHTSGCPRAAVSLTYRDDGLELCIVDGGSDTPPHPDWKPGRGISGMRERIHAVGGTLESGPATPPDPVGWTVRARIPLSDNGPDPVEVAR